METANLIPFSFRGHSVSVIEQEGEPWWIANEVCSILGIGNPAQAVNSLDYDEKSSIIISDRTPMGGSPNRIIINESGLYSLILRSRKPGARAFKKWITKEVLPSIRKTGAYLASDPINALNDPATMRSLLLTYTEKVLALEDVVKQQAPKVEALDRISGSVGMTCITDAAKALQIRPIELFRFLSEHKWIYRRVGGKGWIAYQEKLQQGLLAHKVYTVTLSDGSEKASERALVTPKGLAKLSMLLGKELVN